MKQFISTKSLAVMAVALGTLAAASSVQARSDVYFSIGIQSPGFYVQPAPVYVQPRSFYTPAPGYYQRHDNGRHYGWQQGQRRGFQGDRIGSANGYPYGDPRHQARLQGPYGDLDRDGIRNQQDRDRDGDGVRNRFDRLPDNYSRR